MRILILAATVLTMHATAVPAEEPQFVNGAFDDVVPSNGTGGGWTTRNVHSSAYLVDFGAPEPSFNLASFGNEKAGDGLRPEPSANSEIEQTLVGLGVGNTYAVSGDYFTLLDVGPPNSFDLRLDGVTILSLEQTPIGQFTSFSAMFTATAPSHTIAFVANGTNQSYILDNISLMTVTVPVEEFGWGGLKGLFQP